jgi:hypothetical protein
MSRSVQIDADKVRNLKFNYNALIMLEEDFNLDITKLGTQFKLSDFRTILYCGFKHEDPDLTLEQVGDIIDIILEKHGMEYLAQKIGEAFEKAFGKLGNGTKNLKEKK